MKRAFLHILTRVRNGDNDCRVLMAEVMVAAFDSFQNPAMLLQ